MNHIINIIIRQVVNQLVRRSVHAGFNKVGEMSQQRKAQNVPADALDDYGNPVQAQMSPEEERQQRQARRQARQARLQMKAAQRGTRM